jgi:hypothetical protein
VESEERSGAAVGDAPEHRCGEGVERRGGAAMSTRRARPGRRPRIPGAVPPAIQPEPRTPRGQRRTFCALRPGCSGIRRCTERRTPPTGACCPRPDGRQRIRGPSRCQPGDANYCGRGLAGGSATCRSGGCGAASRRAPSQGHPEPSARSRTDKGACARCRRSPHGFPSRTHGAWASLPDHNTPRRAPRVRPATRRARPPPS